VSPFGPLIPPQPVVYSQPSDFVGPLFSYSYELFVAPKKGKSFVIRQIRTLAQNTRGVGAFLSGCSRSHRPRVTSHVFSFACRLFVVSLRSFPHSFPLFSTACSLFYENTRVGGIVRTQLTGFKDKRARRGVPSSQCRLSPCEIRAAVLRGWRGELAATSYAPAPLAKLATASASEL
jgi:hypothetical protein